LVLIAGCNSGLADNVPDFIFGMAIGVGGGSVLSRALGAKKTAKQNHFCQSNYDDLYFMSLFVVYIFSVLKCYCFGAKGAIIAPVAEFFQSLFLCLSGTCMMGNNIIRAEGKAKFAMVAMIIPALSISY
jgi:Na+-driven multidrug efflux pump